MRLDSRLTEQLGKIRFSSYDRGNWLFESLVRYCTNIYCHWVVISLTETRIANARRYDTFHTEVVAISVRDAGVVAVIC